VRNLPPLDHHAADEQENAAIAFSVALTVQPE
jgi:hypothetical protein